MSDISYCPYHTLTRSRLDKPFGYQEGVSNTTGKQLSNGVTRFDVKWSVNWFVSLAVNSIDTLSHVTLFCYCIFLIYFDLVCQLSCLNQMPPQVICTCTRCRLCFVITPDNQTFQGNLVSATTQTNHLKQDQLAITSATMATSEVPNFWFNQSLDYIPTYEHSSFTAQCNPSSSYHAFN